MCVTKAIRIKTIVVEDPDSKADVELEVYKDPVAGSIFAVDAAFIDQVSVFIPSVFNSGTLQLDDDDELEKDNQRRLPTSAWPDSDSSADDSEYGVTITVDVSATSFEDAREAFLNALAMGGTDTTIFHVEHLRSGTVRELD
jgi:hypothetical protein